MHIKLMKDHETIYILWCYPGQRTETYINMYYIMRSRSRDQST